MAVAQTEPGLSRRQAMVVPDGTTHSVIICLFIMSLMLPIILNVGPLAMPPSRLFVLLMFFPSFGLWLSGRAGPKRAMDYLLLFAASWASLSVLFHHGIGGGYERAGFIVVEMVGGYFFGRSFVRSARDFKIYLGFAMGALIFMLPFGLLESQSGAPIIIDALARVFETEAVIDHEIRLGLERAQVIFPHPILYGVFCAAMLGVVVRGLNFGSGFFASAMRVGVITVNTICSVSSGAFLMFIVQAGFLVYDRVMRTVKARWRLMLLGVILAYVFLALVADSSPSRVFVRYFTLNASTGHYRIVQFDAVMDNILRDPLLGIGFKPWTRPHWMIPSIDNFWLVITVRHGIPFFLAFLGGILLTMYRLGKLRFVDPMVGEMRSGYSISLGGFLLAIITVHVWSNINVWFMFFLGAGMWMFDAKQADAVEAPSNARARTPAHTRNRNIDAEANEGSDDVEAETAPQAVQSRYTRFPVKPKHQRSTSRPPTKGR